VAEILCRAYPTGPLTTILRHRAELARRQQSFHRTVVRYGYTLLGTAALLRRLLV
jgi:hypothetical protein